MRVALSSSTAGDGWRQRLRGASAKHADMPEAWVALRHVDGGRVVAGSPRDVGGRWPSCRQDACVYWREAARIAGDPAGHEDIAGRSTP